VFKSRSHEWDYHNRGRLHQNRQRVCLAIFCGFSAGETGSADHVDKVPPVVSDVDPRWRVVSGRRPPATGSRTRRVFVSHTKHVPGL
jgi:hypothetical protein